MSSEGTLDFFSLWAMWAATIIFVLLFVEVGFRLGRFRRLSDKEKESPVSAIVGATLGLLAFMLAFTFGTAASRFGTRRLLVLDEANAIGTTYLRAEMLAEPQRTEVRKLLREYVDVRLAAVRPDQLEPAIRRSEELQNQLWQQAVAVSTQDSRSVIAGLFIQSLNEVIDLHSKRIAAGLRSRIPGSIWFGLYLLTAIAMTSVGYHAGLSGACRSIALLALVIAFSAVILLIADLDRPREGLLRVSQQAMIDLQKGMSAPKQ
jgi:membrane protein YdbS with pleckstrin-like domain